VPQTQNDIPELESYYEARRLWRQKSPYKIGKKRSSELASATIQIGPYTLPLQVFSKFNTLDFDSWIHSGSTDVSILLGYEPEEVQNQPNFPILSPDFLLADMIWTIVSSGYQIRMRSKKRTDEWVDIDMLTSDEWEVRPQSLEVLLKADSAYEVFRHYYFCSWRGMVYVRNEWRKMHPQPDCRRSSAGHDEGELLYEVVDFDQIIEQMSGIITKMMPKRIVATP